MTRGRSFGLIAAMACTLWASGCPDPTITDLDGDGIHADAVLDTPDVPPNDGWDEQDAWWPFGARGGPSTATLCAAGGTVSDGDYTGVVCVGPVALTGQATDSQGYSWQPGPTYQVSP